MIKKILAVLAAIGAFFSAVFYVLFKQAKDEQKIQQAEAVAEKAQAEAAVAKKQTELKKEDEELAQKSHSGNKLDNFNAGINRLQNASQRGKARNAGTGNSGN